MTPTLVWRQWTAGIKAETERMPAHTSRLGLYKWPTAQSGWEQLSNYPDRRADKAEFGYLPGKSAWCTSKYTSKQNVFSLFVRIWLLLFFWLYDTQLKQVCPCLFFPGLVIERRITHVLRKQFKISPNWTQHVIQLFHFCAQYICFPNNHVSQSGKMCSKTMPFHMSSKNLVPQQTTSCITMKSTCLFILASLVVCNLTVCGAQGIPDEDDTDRMTIDDIFLQRAESLLLRSILRKMQNEERSGA